MTQNLRTRSKTAASLFIRRIQVHGDILQDETSSMNQSSTMICLLINLYIQIVPTNNLGDTALNMILGSSKWVPAIFITGFAVTLALLILRIISLTCEKEYVIDERNCSLNPPEHVKSVWYKFYKHLFRYHFLLLEPILSGYSFSLLLPSSAFNSYPIFPQVCAIVGGGLGLIISILYLVTVESILPNPSFTSSTNRVNVGLISIGLRLCMFLDYNYSYSRSRVLIFVLLLIMLTPSIVGLYYSLFKTNFFGKYARLYFSGFHATKIIYSLIYFIFGGYSTSVTIVPACLFVALGLRVVYNLNTRVTTNLDSLSADKFTDIMNLATVFFQNSTDWGKKATVKALRFQALMSHLSTEKKNNIKEHMDKFASANELANGNDPNPVVFVLYLFERAWQSSGKRDFMVLVYETSWAIALRMNLFHISILISRFESLDLNFIEQGTLRALIRLIERSTKDIYHEKQSLIPVNEQFYQSQSVAEQNASVARDHNLIFQDDDSNGDWNMGKTNVQSRVYKTDLQNFDIYSSMKNIEKYQKLLDKMQETISTLLKFYDSLNKRVIEIESVHETMKEIRGLKESVNKLFRNLEIDSGEQSQYHLLPYAVFLESINNDRQASQRILKAYDHRCQLFERSRYIQGNRTSAKFDLGRMLCVGVECTHNTLGRINYLSENCEEVLGQPIKHYEGRTISCLLTDEFQPMHEEMLSKFVKDQDKPYLGAPRERLVRVKEQIYTKCEVMVRLSPVLESRSLSFVCLLRRNLNNHEFMVINHQGTIVGRSQGLDWADFVMNKPHSAIQASLTKMTADKIKSLLQKNNAVMSKALTVFVREPQEIGEFPEERSRKLSSQRHNDHLDPNYFEDLDSAKRHLINPVKFMFNGKNIFTDLLLNFSPQIGEKAKESLNLSLSQQEYQLSSSVYSRKHKKALKPIMMDTPTSQSRSPKAFPKPILVLDELQKVQTSDKALKVLYRRTGSNISSYAKMDITQITPPPGERSELLMPPKIAFPVEPTWNIKVNAPPPEIVKEVEDMMKELDGQSSRRSSVYTGSMYSGNIKARVLSTMSSQRKYMVWKEVLAIILLQILIWSACGYTQSLLNNSFGSQLGDFIKLRTGFGKVLMVSSYSFSAGVQAVERMLVYRNRLPVNKYQAILPSISWSSSSALGQAISTMQNWSMQLTAHVFSFDDQLSKRYLEEKYNYTYFYYGEENGTGQTMTKTLDLLDHARETNYVMKRWNAGMDFNGTNFRFSNRLVGEYYNLMTSGWTAVSYNTVANIIDRDTESYEIVVANVKLITQLSIVGSIVLAVLCAVLFWSMRLKMINLYSILERMLPFEIVLMQDRMMKLQNTFNKQKYSESRAKYHMSKMANKFDYSYHMYRKTNNISRTFLKTKIGLSSWLGIGWVIMVVCATIVGYQLVEYITVNNLSKKLGRLLMLQQQQRTLMVTTNFMSAIHFNSYFMASKAAGYATASLPDLDAFSVTLSKYRAIFDENISQLDRFITQLPLDQEETLNFKDLLTDKPCDYLNYKSFSLPRSECEALADFTMNKSIIEAYRWVRLQMPTFSENLYHLKNFTDPISYLVNREFLNFQFIRRNFFVDFVSQFTTKFFEELTEYHQAMFVKPLDSILLVCLLLCIGISILAVSTAIIFTIQNLEAGLQVFLLVPPESYYHNPHIAAKLLTITRT